MAVSINGDRATIKSRFAWSVWILHGIFLLFFPPLIWAMWTTETADIPVYASAVFTGLYLLCVPWLLRGLATETLVSGEIDRKAGTVRLVTRGLAKRSVAARPIDDIDRIEMRTTDNDGEFHSVYLVFRDGTYCAVLHGNDRVGVEDKRDTFLDFIRQRRPDVTVVETRV